MASSIPAFSAAELPTKIQLDPNGRKRKLPALPDGRTKLDLQKDCELLSLLQYSCTVDRPDEPGSSVQCWPVPRLFRKCQDKRGTFMVETTAWEGFPGCPAGKPAEVPVEKHK
ncbi:hypothetical protein RB594_005681 [Gaeumannomyces avenae]